MKRMKDMKIDFRYILHALHVLHGKIKYSILTSFIVCCVRQNTVVI